MLDLEGKGGDRQAAAGKPKAEQQFHFFVLCLLLKELCEQV